jgi:hypothetical protein
LDSSEDRKKRIERGQLELLLSTLGLTEIGEMVPSERPDCLIPSSSIGVEVTSILMECLKQRSSEEALVLDQSRDICVANGSPPCVVHVQFSGGRLKKTRRSSLANQLAAVVTALLFDCEDDKQSEASRLTWGPDWPSEIDAVIVTRLSNLRRQEWPHGGAAWLRAPDRGRLQEAITIKGDGLSEYRATGMEYWLLMVLPAGEQTLFDLAVERRQLLSDTYHSSFDRTLLLQELGPILMELKPVERTGEVVAQRWQPASRA